MKKIRFLVWLQIAWLLAACATPPHRARQYHEAFETLPSEIRERALLGTIKTGDPHLAVYVAMGEPQGHETTISEGGIHEEHWIYVGRARSTESVQMYDNYSFVTVNDFSVESLFLRSPDERIHVVFMGDGVVRVDLVASDGSPIMKKAPRMVMPRASSF